MILKKNMKGQAKIEDLDAFIDGAKASKAETPKKPTSPEPAEKKPAPVGRPPAGDKDERTKQTFVISKKHLDLIRACSYWDRIEQRDIISAALDLYFAGKDYNPLPPAKKA